MPATIETPAPDAGAPTTLATPATANPDENIFRASRRMDGWTGEKQAAFLEHVADGHSVELACRMVGLSAASAYAFRRRAAGQAFALGWRAACLIARDKVADDLMHRAMEGQTVTLTRPDGSEVTRHLYDNNLALRLLVRLDRQAEEASDADARAARLVAGEFDAFVDMVEREGACPARAGLFLARRLPGADGAESGDSRDLGPVLALAAADRFARTGVATAAEVDIADLDARARAGWTAEQWQRAEAAGVVAIAAPAPPPAPEPLVAPQHCQRSAPAPFEAFDGSPVWWDESSREWRTRFPPPDDFDGDEVGDRDHVDYERSLSDAETVAVGDPDRYDEAELAERAAERDRWFALFDPEDASVTEQKGHGSDTARHANAMAAREGEENPRKSSAAQSEPGRQGATAKR